MTTQELLEYINTHIKANGKGEITGDMLGEILTEVVNKIDNADKFMVFTLVNDQGNLSWDSTSDKELVYEYVSTHNYKALSKIGFTADDSPNYFSPIIGVCDDGSEIYILGMNSAITSLGL